MTYATVDNMREAERRGKQVFAFSPFTMEQVSATPGDYWHLGDEPLLDAEGNQMVLAVKVTRYIDALTGEDLIAATSGGKGSGDG